VDHIQQLTRAIHDSLDLKIDNQIPYFFSLVATYLLLELIHGSKFVDHVPQNYFAKGPLGSWLYYCGVLFSVN
jgi:hypothetical protein